MMFALKKIVSTFFFPVALLGLLLGVGVLLLWRKDNPACHRWGRRMVTAAAVCFWVLGSSWTGDLALWPLLQQHPRLDVAALRAEKGADWSPDYLVVLSAGHEHSAETPPNLRLCERSMARVNLAFELHQAFPETPILCAGGVLFDGFAPVSRDLVAVLRKWGVSGELLVTEEESRDTAGNVRFLRERLEGKEFLLITSATHMPRSVALFRHAGLKPIPAPERDHGLSVAEPKDWWRGLVPNGGNFARVEAAAYEYLGLGWAKLSGQI